MTSSVHATDLTVHVLSLVRERVESGLRDVVPLASIAEAARVEPPFVNLLHAMLVAV